MCEHTQTETPSLPQSQPNSDSTVLPDHPVDAPSNPSKISIRPQKIRKLSSDSSQCVVTITKYCRRGGSQSTKALLQIVKPLSVNGEIENAHHHLGIADPLLAYKTGTSIYTRFVSLCGGDDDVCPDVVLSLTTKQLKQIGISGRKTSCLYDLANKYKTGIFSDESVLKMDARSLFTMLSMVKGIGSWSVHMFMIFSLHRPDVLRVSDLGVRKGVKMLYGLEEWPRPSPMEQLCEKWRPYRSIGAWYMWWFIEEKGTPTTAAGLMEGGLVQPLQQIEPQQEVQQHQLQLLEPINAIGSFGYVYQFASDCL
ncbi:unnamed protein product [Withania somnifera]